MYKLMKQLYPLCRSITGNGVRDTLGIIKDITPIVVHEVPSGTKVFDWIVPLEWNIKDAYVKNSKGEKVINFKNNNLHIVSYSEPLNSIINYIELKKHIFTLEKYPDWIPYRTTYYKKDWGFCMKHNDFLMLQNENYEVHIDSELKNGTLTYADLVIKGTSSKEILISTYICHPSMCNDILSGIVLTTYLAKYLLEKQDNYYTYRFVFIPETIGSIIYLSKNLDYLKQNIIGGYVVTCVGDEGEFTYLKTREENQLVDKISLYVLENNCKAFKVRDYITCGSDERQYNYPGVDLNIGSLMKTKYHEFPEYHTSADNFNLVTEKGLNESIDMYKKCISLFEINHYYKTTTICEPQLGKYGLYNLTGGSPDIYQNKTISGHLISKVLKYCDGKHDLIDISNKLNIRSDICSTIINKLLKNNLIKLSI